MNQKEVEPSGRFSAENVPVAAPSLHPSGEYSITFLSCVSDFLVLFYDLNEFFFFLKFTSDTFPLHYFQFLLLFSFFCLVDSLHFMFAVICLVLIPFLLKL